MLQFFYRAASNTPISEAQLWKAADNKNRQAMSTSVLIQISFFLAITKTTTWGNRIPKQAANTISTAIATTRQIMDLILVSPVQSAFEQQL